MNMLGTSSTGTAAMSDWICFLRAVTQWTRRELAGRVVERVLAWAPSELAIKQHLPIYATAGVLTYFLVTLAKSLCIFCTLTLEVKI
ncbi:hypothetical protein BDZ85DRAFT_262404 [Elsinoe ampelina]|uniref:Uncharacterized protein n=1 Tax=Elsinoe ampelina TaxID=302913 RepID=A0A6A6GDV2_9PEZI|nr:hypothetical protein BDZ85DRAFT_262404 [Elsinoe ampelina]